VVFVMFTYTVDVISMPVPALRREHPAARLPAPEPPGTSTSRQLRADPAQQRDDQRSPDHRHLPEDGDLPTATRWWWAPTRGPAKPTRRSAGTSTPCGRRLVLRTVSLGMIGHVFRGMYDHEFDRTRIAGALGPQVSTSRSRTCFDIWEKVTRGRSRPSSRPYRGSGSTSSRR